MLILNLSRGICLDFTKFVFDFEHAQVIELMVRCYLRWKVSNEWAMALLPDKENCGLRMRRECWERFSRLRR